MSQTEFWLVLGFRCPVIRTWPPQNESDIQNSSLTVRARACMSVCACARLRVLVGVYLCACVHVCVCMCECVQVCVSARACMYAYMAACVLHPGWNDLQSIYRHVIHSTSHYTTSLFFSNHNSDSTREAASSRVTYFIPLAYTGTGVSHS